MATITRNNMGWSSTTARNAVTDTGLVIHYNGLTSWNLASKRCDDAIHGCKGYWEWCRKFHIQTRKWKDVGYSYFVCPHGNEYVGRGYGKEQAAQPGGNMTWTSVTTALGAGEKPTTLQIEGIRRLRAKLMRRGMKAAISWHGRFISTSCPGTVLIEMVKAGEFSKPPTGEEHLDEMGFLPVLRMGDKGKDVVTLRALLIARGAKVTTDDILKWITTDTFSAEVKTLVLAFQEDAFPGDEDEWDGIVGIKTWSKLERRRKE